MGFSDASVFAKVSLPWMVAGFIFHIVGFPSDSWVDANGGNVGLFRVCGDLIACVSVDNNTAPGWFRVSLAFEIIGFIFMLIAVVAVIIYVFMINNNKIVRIASIICNCIAIAFIFIGFVIYAGRFGEVWSDALYDLGWSFALVVVSYICLFIGLVCQFLDLCVPTNQNQRLDNPHV